MCSKKTSFVISFSGEVGTTEMKPNLTLMSSLLVTATDGKKGISRGFWGDVVTGPFIAFGHQVKRGRHESEI